MSWARIAAIARKLRLIAQSDLTNRDKVSYMLDRCGRGTGVITYRLRGDVCVSLRRGTTDSRVFDEIFLERAYAPCVAALPANLGRITLIDLGANIGLSALFLARALEVDEFVAVEPDADNFELLSKNLQSTGLANRSIAIRAFAGVERGFAEVHDSGNGAWGMRLGPRSETGTPVLPLGEIAGAAKTGATLVLKCDIEGGERQLFLCIRDWEHLIRYILLELHTEFLSVPELSECLASSGFQWTIRTPLSGVSIALLLLERGEPRNRI